MQDGYRIFGNGKSSKTTKKNQHHKFPSGLGYPKPEGKDEGESYTLFRTLPYGERKCHPNTNLSGTHRQSPMHGTVQNDQKARFVFPNRSNA